MIIGIDLALRNTGIVVLNSDGSFKDCKLITSDPKKTNDVELLLHNYNRISEYLIFASKDIKEKEEWKIGLEGLSFNSKSSSVDLIAANHWKTRCFIYYLRASLNIIPPKSWMKTIVTKDALKALSDKYPTVRAKKGSKLNKEQTSANTKAKAQRRKDSKALVLNSVPTDVKDAFEKYILTNKLDKDTIYDLADAYCIAKYILDGKNG